MSPIPFGGIEEEEEERVEGKALESNKQFEGKISASSPVETLLVFFFALKLLLTSSRQTVEITAGCPSSPLLQHMSLSSQWMEGHLGPPATGLVRPFRASANYTLRTREEPSTRVPSRIDGAQQGVSCLVGCQMCRKWCPRGNVLEKQPICETLEPQLQKNLLESEESRACDFRFAVRRLRT